MKKFNEFLDGMNSKLAGADLVIEGYRVISKLKPEEQADALFRFGCAYRFLRRDPNSSVSMFFKDGSKPHILNMAEEVRGTLRGLYKLADEKVIDETQYKELVWELIKSYSTEGERELAIYAIFMDKKGFPFFDITKYYAPGTSMEDADYFKHRVLCSKMLQKMEKIIKYDYTQYTEVGRALLDLMHECETEEETLMFLVHLVKIYELEIEVTKQMFNLEKTLSNISGKLA